MNPKFCPFCGEGNSIVGCYQDDLGYWKVGCGACGSHSGTRPKSDPDGRAKVIANWNKAADAINRCSELTERYRKALEVIAGQPQHVLEAMQARAALENIGPSVAAVSSPSTEGGNG